MSFRDKTYPASDHPPRQTSYEKDREPIVFDFEPGRRAREKPLSSDQYVHERAFRGSFFTKIRYCLHASNDYGLFR